MLALITILFGVGCASGRKAYLKGDYYKSVQQAVARLQQKPTHKESKDILYFAYPELLKYNGEKINTLKKSGDALRWEKVMDLYSEMNQASDLIQRCPAAKKIIDAKSFNAEYDEARRNAAEIHYAQALQYISLKDRNSLKSAYSQLKRTLDLNPNHSDAPTKLRSVKNDLTLKVVIQPIPMHSALFSLSNEFFETQLVDYFRKHAGEFVEFYTASDRIDDADQYLVMRFDDFNVGQTYVKEKSEERKRDNVVIGKNAITKDSSVNVYGTVTAKVRLFQKSISSGGLLDVKMIDANSNSILSQQKFPGTFVWEDRWGMFMGDERALTDEDRSYMNHGESPNPAPQQLFIEFTKPIFQQTTRFVDGFYKSF